MIRQFIIGVLSLAAIWLTVTWIATFIWPEQYSMARFLKYAQRPLRVACGIGVQETFDGEEQINWRRFPFGTRDTDTRPTTEATSLRA